MPTVVIRNSSTVHTRAVDTYLTSSSGADLSYGAAVALLVGTGGAPPTRRGLLKFDLSILPAGAVVTAANLKLDSVEMPGAASTVSVHRALTEWYVGPGGADGATPGAGVDASTWNYRNVNGTVAWGAAGGQSGTDYAATATDSVTVSTFGACNFDVTDDVADWQAGTADNYGWFVLGNESVLVDALVTFSGADGTYVAQRAELTVTYTGDALDDIELAADSDVTLASIETTAPRLRVIASALASNQLYTTYCSVTFADTVLTDVLDVRIQNGFDRSVAQCDITVTQLPTGAAPWDVVSIILGNSQATACVRFEGYFLDPDYQLWPGQVMLKCQGYLCLTDIYQSDDRIDMSGYSADPDDYGRTDIEMVGQVFYICGIIDENGDSLTGNTVTIDGNPDRDLGKVSTGKGFKWEEGENGLAYIQRLDEVTGYRTFDLIDGGIRRQYISATPDGDPVAIFAEGVDIFQGQATPTILEISNKIIVTGWTGDKVVRTATASAESPWLLKNYGTIPWYREKSFSSGMIENGNGITCQEVANRMLAENNRRLLKLTLSTPRDDAIEPGDTIYVNALAHLGVNQQLWVQSIDVKMAGGFEQTLTCIGTYEGIPPIYDALLTEANALLLLENGSGLELN